MIRVSGLVFRVKGFKGFKDFTNLNDLGKAPGPPRPFFKKLLNI